MFAKPIGQLTAADIERLVELKIPESETLDYKEKCYESAHAEKLAKHIAAFANTRGGDLIFGLAEARTAQNEKLGYPCPPVGVVLPQRGADVLRDQMFDLARAKLEPPLAGLQFTTVGEYTQGPVVVLRVPRSPARPHAVRTAGGSSFRARSEKGGYEMSVHEVRSMILAGASFAQTTRAFHEERLRMIHRRMPGAFPGDAEDLLAPRVPTGLVHSTPTSAALMIHIFSAGFGDGALLRTGALDLATIPVPKTGDSWASRPNADGVLCWPEMRSAPGSQFGYFQVFRTGVVEIVDTQEVNGGGEVLRGDRIETFTTDATAAAVAMLNQLGAAFPLVVFVSIIKARSKTIENAASLAQAHAATSNLEKGTHVISKVLTLPDVVVERPDEAVDVALEPVYEALWNASGRRARPA